MVGWGWGWGCRQGAGKAEKAELWLVPDSGASAGGAGRHLQKQITLVWSAMKGGRPTLLWAPRPQAQ